MKKFMLLLFLSLSIISFAQTKQMNTVENNIKKEIDKTSENIKKLPKISTTADSTDTYVEKDLKDFYNKKVKPDMDTISTGVSKLKKAISNRYREVGFTNFVREFKYIFIMIFLLVVLSLLWLRNRKI